MTKDKQKTKNSSSFPASDSSSFFNPSKSKRKNLWHQYFLKLAKHASTMSTCDRKNVGAIAVKKKRVMCTGFNGAPKGAEHCSEAGHDLVEINGRKSCSRAVHAEANLIAQAAHFGISLKKAKVYVTMFPCHNCFKLLASAGISKIYYEEEYEGTETELTKNMAKELDITLKKLKI